MIVYQFKQKCNYKLWNKIHFNAQFDQCKIVYVCIKYMYNVLAPHLRKFYTPIFPC